MKNTNEYEMALVQAFINQDEALEMEKEYNNRQTIQSLIEDMVDEFSKNLVDDYIAPPFDQGPRPKFDWTRCDDEENRISFKTIRNIRASRQSYYEEMVTKERATLEKSKIDAFRSSCYSSENLKELVATHKLRNRNTTYVVKSVDLKTLSGMN